MSTIIVNYYLAFHNSLVFSNVLDSIDSSGKPIMSVAYYLGKEL